MSHADIPLLIDSEVATALKALLTVASSIKEETQTPVAYVRFIITATDMLDPTGATSRKDRKVWKESTYV